MKHTATDLDEARISNIVRSADWIATEYNNESSPSTFYSVGSATTSSPSTTITTYYFHPDHLSPRVTTDSSGNVIGQQGHFPFGESWYAASTTTKYQFTSYERDSESGNDYAQARYHINRLGRFSSPDLISGSPSNPQSLNRYLYTRNDPVNLSDSTGMDPSCSSSDDPSSGGARPCAPIYEFGADPGDFGCTLDGIATSCGAVAPNSQDAVQCPNNACAGYNSNGQFVEFVATDTGARYYNVLYGQPGSLFYTLDAAGIASSTLYLDKSVNDKREAGGNVYEDSSGFYSFSPAQWGPPCQPTECDLHLDTTLIPAGTTRSAEYHTHPLQGPGSEDFSDHDFVSITTPPLVYGYLATVAPPGQQTSVPRVVFADPEKVLSGPPMGGVPATCVLQGPLLGMQSCH